MKQTFSTAIVLSVTVDRFVCDNIGQIYEILNYITGDNLFTHALPRAGRFAKPFILEAYPELAIPTDKESELDATGTMERSEVRPFIDRWLASLNLPASYEIESHADAWLAMDPVSELEGMVGKDRVLTVALP